MKISGKRAFITGAASGIGKETALVLAQAGADVLATDISREALAGLEAQAARENLAIRTAQLDVTNRAAYETLAAGLHSAGQMPHIAVNNAGVVYIGSLFETAPATWERLLNINVMGSSMAARSSGHGWRKVARLAA